MDAQQDPRTTEEHQDTGSQYTLPPLISGDAPENTADQAYQMGIYAGQQDQPHAAGSSAPVASRSRNPPPHSSRAYRAVWALRKKMMKDKKTNAIPLPTPENFDSVFQAFDPSSNLSDLDRVQQDDRTPFDFHTAVSSAWQRANLIYVPSQSCSFLTQIEGTYRQCRNPSTSHQDDVWPSHVIKWCNDHHKWPEAISQVLEGRDFHNVWQVLTNGEKQSLITWDHEQRVAAAAQVEQLQSWVDEWH